MKKYRLFALGAICSAAAIVAACGGGDSDDDVAQPVDPVDPPVVIPADQPREVRTLSLIHI